MSMTRRDIGVRYYDKTKKITEKREEDEEENRGHRNDKLIGYYIVLICIESEEPILL